MSFRLKALVAVISDLSSITSNSWYSPTALQITSKGLVCSDIDECSDQIHNCSATVKSAQCRNYYGGYTCNCPSGERLTIDVISFNNPNWIATDINGI